MVSYLLGVYNPHQDKDLGYNAKDPFRVYHGIDCVKNFVDDFIVASFRGYIFYSHFGSIFDFPIILDELNKRDFNIYPIMKGSKIIKIVVSDNVNHRWYFCDSSALLNFSLDELTKTFKVEHPKLEIVKKDNNYDRNLYNLYCKNPDLVIKYLRNDCIGLYEVLDKFKNEILKLGGDLGLTIASTSLKTFSRGYQHHNFYMCPKDLNDELRLGYYGGRTEIFRMVAPKQENDVYYYYDINSLYPFVMKKYEYPVSQPMIVSTPKQNVYMENNGVTLAHIKTPDKLYIPLLPHKLKVGDANKLMFILGNYKGWWDNDFLRKAKEIGYSIEPLKSYLFNSEFIFKDFVDDFYKVKKDAEKDTPMYLIAKLIMNSLYGKYGQRQISESLIKDANPDKEKYIIKDFDIDTGWSTVIEEGKGKFYLPQISIHVTSMAQLWLYKSIEEILEKDYNVYYCDTDSIISDYKNLRVSKELGDWKLEKKIVEGYFVLPKMYKILLDGGKQEIRAKGYSQKLQNKINPDAFNRALFNDDYQGFSVISDLPEMLRAKSSFRRFKDFNKLDFIRRSIQTRYNKRKVLPDFNTRAYNIKELT